jgi:phage terminase small subunit
MAADEGPALSGGLTVRQRKFVAALLAAPTVREAAKVAGICETTSHRYLADPRVRAALAERQDGVLGQVSRRLASEMNGALDVLAEVMHDAEAPPSARVSAARAVLDSGLKLAELVTLAERVADIERRLDEGEAGEPE